MLIAQEKKKKNLAEYILYMWQVEDFIRACNFDMKQITEQRILPLSNNKEEEKKLYDWYENLLLMMQNESIREKGHLQILKNNVAELTDIHNRLLFNKNGKYLSLYTTAQQTLEEFRLKSKQGNNTSDVEVALTALYTVLMLKIGGKTVSKDTLQAIQPFSQLLAFLSATYNKEQKELLQQ